MNELRTWIKDNLKWYGWALTVFGGLFYATMFMFGYNLTKYDTIMPGKNAGLLLLEILALGVIGCICLILLFKLCSEKQEVMARQIRPAKEAGSTEEAEDNSGRSFLTKARVFYYSFIEKKYAFFVIWAVILLCWLPFYLSSYPGIFSYDSNLQFNWYFTKYRCSHHPLLHTYMLGGLVELGFKLWGTYQAGAVLYAVTQMLIISALLAGILVYLTKLKAPMWLVVAGLLFFGFYPANVYLSFAATKDPIFSAMFGLFAALLLGCYLDADAFFKKKGNVIGLIALLFFMMILRNNTQYMVIAMTPFFLVWHRKHWKQVLPVIVVPLLMLKIYSGPVYDAWGVERGDAREAYNSVIQTISRTYNLHPEDFTEEEKELLFSVIPEDYIVRYVSHKGDEVRWGFDTPAFNARKGDFMKMWIQKGIQHPLSYIDGFFATTFGLWYPWDELPDPTTIRVYVEYFFGPETQEILGIHFDPKTPEIFHKISYKICQDSVLTRIPVIGGILFGAGTFLWIMFFALLYCIWKLDWNYFLTVMIPLWAYFCTLLLGPVGCMRYMYPFMTALPVIVCGVLFSKSYT